MHPLSTGHRSGAAPGQPCSGPFMGGRKGPKRRRAAHGRAEGREHQQYLLLRKSVARQARGAGRPWGRDCPSEEGLSQFSNMSTARRLGAVGEREDRPPLLPLGPPGHLHPRDQDPRPLPSCWGPGAARHPLMVQGTGSSRDLRRQPGGASFMQPPGRPPRPRGSLPGRHHQGTSRASPAVGLESPRHAWRQLH